MTLFINDLDENGKVRTENTHCNQCDYITNSYHGLRVHMAIHRDKIVTSYHDKENLFKSRRWTYET